MQEFTLPDLIACGVVIALIVSVAYWIDKADPTEHFVKDCLLTQGEIEGLSYFSESWYAMKTAWIRSRYQHRVHAATFEIYFNDLMRAYHNRLKLEQYNTDRAFS